MFYGPLVSVVDGDTFKVRVQGVVMVFRLEGVDAPERNQPYGTEATTELRRLIQHPLVVLVPTDVDRYGRTVVRVWIENRYVNLEMVRRGAAWFEPEYARDDLLFQAEDQARDEEVGMWALPAADRVEPWVWRHEKR